MSERTSGDRVVGVDMDVDVDVDVDVEERGGLRRWSSSGVSRSRPPSSKFLLVFRVNMVGTRMN